MRSSSSVNTTHRNNNVLGFQDVEYVMSNDAAALAEVETGTDKIYICF